MNIIETHRFFCRESPGYMQGVPRSTYLLGFPRAYLRFMWYMYKHRN